MKYLIISLLSLTLIACSSNNGGTSSRVRPVKSVVAQRAEFIEKDFAGMATPLEEVNLAFKVSGQVEQLPVSTGQSIYRGEILAQLDARDFELQMAADRSSYEQAQSRLSRAERLLEREAVSRQEYEGALTEYAQAKLTYENSKEILSQTELKAPFDAVIEGIFVDAYERVQSGQPIVKIVTPYTTSVSFTLPESSFKSLLQSGTSFTVVFDNYRDMKFNATIKDYALTTSDASGFPVTLTIENPAPLIYRITPGFSCTITMRSEDLNHGAISLPLTAIYAPATGGNYVWVINNEGRVELRDVTLGELYGTDRIIVDSGVKSGERVVSAGVYQLAEGDKVKIIQ